MTPSRPLPLAGLLLLPLLLGVGFVLLPHVHPSEPVADACAAAWTSLAVIAALATASSATTSLRVRAIVGAAGLFVLVGVAARGGSSLGSVTAVGLALASLAWSIGGGIGLRIAHPGHLAPACAVAAGADLMSVLSPEGPSRAIAESEAAVSALVVAGPVPGHAGAVAPTIGLGDLVFIALLFGAAATHGIPRGRVAMTIVLGVAASLALSGVLRTAVPALPAIGLASVALVPAFRTIRPRDRSAARVGIAIGVAMATIAVGRSLWASP